MQFRRLFICHLHLWVFIIPAVICTSSVTNGETIQQLRMCCQILFLLNFVSCTQNAKLHILIISLIDLFFFKDPWLFKELDEAVVCPEAWCSFNL